MSSSDAALIREAEGEFEDGPVGAGQKVKTWGPYNAACCMAACAMSSWIRIIWKHNNGSFFS